MPRSSQFDTCLHVQIVFDGCGSYMGSPVIYAIQCIFKGFLRDCRYCPDFSLRVNQTVSVHIPAVEVTSLKLFNHRNITGICGGQITLSQVESNCDFTYSPLFPSCHAPLLLIYNLPPPSSVGAGSQLTEMLPGGKEERGGWRDPYIHTCPLYAWQYRLI